MLSRKWVTLLGNAIKLRNALPMIYIYFFLFLSIIILHPNARTHTIAPSYANSRYALCLITKHPSYTKRSQLGL